MALGASNQTSRYGQGVATDDGIVIGQVTILNGTEQTLQAVMDSVFTANSMKAFAPFEVRLESTVSGLELRTTTGVAGAPIQHYPTGGGAHGQPTTLYLAQNISSPKTRLLVANVAGADRILTVTLIG